MADRTNRQTEVHLFGDNDTPITSTTIGPKEHLDVNATISGEVTLASSVPRWNFDDTTVNLTNGVDTNVVTINATGFVDFFS